MLAALGVGSVVLGLALQDTLGALFSGITLLSARQFRTGDWLRVGAATSTGSGPTDGPGGASCEGLLTVVSDSGVWTSYNISEHDHAYLLWLLSSDQGSFAFVREKLTYACKVSLDKDQRASARSRAAETAKVPSCGARNEASPPWKRPASCRTSGPEAVGRRFWRIRSARR